MVSSPLVQAAESIEFAYKLGCVSISMAGIPEELTPVLKKKSDFADAAERSRDASVSDIVEESSPAVENPRSIAAPLETVTGRLNSQPLWLVWVGMQMPSLAEIWQLYLRRESPRTLVSVS